MKTRKNSKLQKSVEKERVKNNSDDNETINQGFTEWLKSGPGVEYMKIFVFFNTLIVFLTMAWPQIEIFYSTLLSFFEEESQEL